MLQRSLIMFEQGIKSENTRYQYKKHVEKFIDFWKLKDFDSILAIDRDKLQEMVEDYMFHLKATEPPNQVPHKMQGIKHFLVMNRKRMDWEIIKKMYPASKKRPTYRGWTTDEVKRMCEGTTNIRNKALVHFFNSTGARVGVFSFPLQMRHIKDLGDGYWAVLLYAGENEEYWSFLIPEATKAISLYLDSRKHDGERFTENTPIFRTKYMIGSERVKPLTRSSVRSVVWRLIRTAKIYRGKVETGRYEVQADHGFRKRFNTILKLNNDVNSNIAEKILGHSVEIPLDNTYLPTSDPRVFQKMFEEFKKAAKDLTIDDSEKKQVQILHLQQEKSENQSLKDRVESLAKENQETKSMLQNLLERLPDKTSTNKPDRS